MHNKSQQVIVMKIKSILMPHTCQKIGWCLLLLALLILVVKAILTFTVHNIDIIWYLAKTTHLLFIVSMFFICLSKEKVEDEMISGLRLKAIGISSYVFFILFMLLSLILELRLYSIIPNYDASLNPYISELFLIVLPILSFGLYYVIFKGLLLRSKKESAL